MQYLITFVKQTTSKKQNKFILTENFRTNRFVKLFDNPLHILADTLNKSDVQVTPKKSADNALRSFDSQAIDRHWISVNC